jgi:hypothetical protein
MGDTATRFEAVKPRIVKGENSALIGLLLMGLGVMRQHVCAWICKARCSNGGGIAL